MRFDIEIIPWLRPLFMVFGLPQDSSFVELGDTHLTLCFGTAYERIPYDNIAAVRRRAWPAFYGYGPKIGPDDGVSYVGSPNVLQVQLIEPASINVWGPFRVDKARCVTLSAENPDVVKNAIEDKLREGGAPQD